MLRFILVCSAATLLTACTSRLEIVIENQSDEPLDLVIQTPSGKSSNPLRLGFSVPGEVFHIELATGERWRSSAARSSQRVDRGGHGDEIFVIERESHLRSGPAPEGVRVTTFEASHLAERATLLFTPESDGWTYTATLKNGDAATVVPFEWSRSEHRSDLNEFLNRYAHRQAAPYSQ